MTGLKSNQKAFFDFTTPMEGIEHALCVASLKWERQSDEEIKMVLNGRWCDYKVFFEYLDDLDIIQLTIWPEGVFVGDSDIAEISEFLARINQQLWIGCFNWDDEAETITFRHTFLAHEAHNIDPCALIDVLDAAKIAFDRFQPFFQLLVTGDVGLKQSLNVAYMDTIGEA